MISSLKERAPSLGLISTQPQGIQQNTGKWNTQLRLLIVKSLHTQNLLKSWYSLQLWCQSIQPIPTAGILYIKTILNPTIQKVSKPPFVTECTFETIFGSSCCRLAARSVHKQRKTVHKKSFFSHTLWVANAVSLVRSEVTHIEVYKWSQIISIFSLQNNIGG